jgi:signal peptidase I
MHRAVHRPSPGPLQARVAHPPDGPSRPCRSPTLYSPLVDRRSNFGCLIEVVETLVLTLVIFFVIQNFIAQPYQVQQQSMEQTLEPGQYVLVDKLTPRWDGYNRGDIVVFNPPPTWTSDPTPFIKRVIGEPGDTIEVKLDGFVYVNGVQLPEPYTFKNEAGDNEPTEVSPDQTTWVVPAGELFLLGDHRQKSADSRVFGPVPISSVIGRAFLRYWPINTLSILHTPTYPDIPAPN